MVKKRQTTKLNKQRCGPYTLKHGRVAQDTCLTNDLMIRVRDAYNKAHPEPNRRIDSADPKQIWRILKTRAQFCNHDGEEECWMNDISDDALKRDIKKYIYAPYSPKSWSKNPNEWLSNFDILNVMQQYEYTYPHFKFFGPSAIDFDAKPSNDQCVSSEICQFNLLDQINAKKTHFGFVFNLDKHDQPGSHWVSMFVDIPAKFIYYFDSASLDRPPEVDVLMKRIQKQARELPTPIELKEHQNKVEHQFGNTECGIYSLFFIITMLTAKIPYVAKRGKRGGKMAVDKRLDLFTYRKITDHMMEKYRKVYYNGGGRRYTQKK